MFYALGNKKNIAWEFQTALETQQLLEAHEKHFQEFNDRDSSHKQKQTISMQPKKNVLKKTTPEDRVDCVSR